MATALAPDETQRRLRAVPRPKPILGRQRELELTNRQRQILDEMEDLVAGGFAELTMAELAARLNCSLRTLYALAASRDELVLVVIDRSLWRIGRQARDAIGEDLAPLDAIRAYLEAATVAVSGWTEGFARDLAAVPAAQHLQDDHNEYLFAVTRTLLDLAVERRDIAPVDTAAVARVLAGLGRFFSGPAVIPTLRSSPKEAADEVVDLIIGGLRALAMEGAS
ncbi:MAG: TetR/AcrR family transcriptional regulator [Microthrixaceae bacterium]